MKKYMIACLLALLMVSPVMAGEDPYIAIVGNDVAANDFYNSPKYQQFTYDQTLFGVPVCAGSFPSGLQCPLSPRSLGRLRTVPFPDAGNSAGSLR